MSCHQFAGTGPENISACTLEVVTAGLRSAIRTVHQSMDPSIYGDIVDSSKFPATGQIGYSWPKIDERERREAHPRVAFQLRAALCGISLALIVGREGGDSARIDP
ncbi:hypothetical protein ACVWY2_004492 [Bradyrhizobium sp. JR6.1]